MSLSWFWRKFRGEEKVEEEDKSSHKEDKKTQKDESKNQKEETRTRRHSFIGSSGVQQNKATRSQSNAADLKRVNQQLSTPVPTHAVTNHKKSRTPTGTPGASSVHSGEGLEVEEDPTDKVVVVGLHDYDARTENELGIRKKEYLEVVEQPSEGWWLVKSLKTGLTGHVPSTHIAEIESIQAEPWYFGNMKRGEVERNLLHALNDHGAFLVRDSESRKNEYSLSVRDMDKVFHYRIRPRDQGGVFITRRDPFPSLHALVAFYSEEERGLCTRLNTPCVRLDTPDIPGLSYNTRDVWEIPQEQIHLVKRLGSGQFGEVWEGRWNRTVTVAVKMLKPGRMNSQEFLDEAKILKNLRHDKLIQLYAVSTQKAPYYIITELMKNGSLLDYLRGHGRGLPTAEQVYIGQQVAAGMQYLEEQKFIHRDLAARNVLVGERHTVKVADFGLSKLIQDEEYEAKAGSKFPIKWTAPEALTFNRFTTKSDVWSFGVMLMEVVTGGATPYPGLSNAEVVDHLERDYRMPQPSMCPSKLYNLMLECWAKTPERRPSFEYLHYFLVEFFTIEEPDYKELGP